jgi:CBS domain-containing protein
MLKGFVEVETQGPLAKETKHYVTEAMRQVAPIHAYDKIEEVLVELNKAGDTGAPVINALGKCIGILTTTDIERYQELLARYEAHDETVVSEMFGTDKYGLVRSGTHEFPQVKAHMTEDVIAVNVSDTIQTAIDVFDANPEIHHLVVVDEEGGPVGILDSEQIVRCGGEMLDGESAQNTEESTVAQS